LLTAPRDDAALLAELQAFGLGQRWVRIAEAIGAEAFLRMWRILDEENLAAPAGRDQARIRVPMLISYLRFRRNQRVRELAAEDLSAKEIRQALLREGCEPVSVRHINRLKTGR
jgi:hypothetical protein